MSKIPPFLILADRGRFLSYQYDGTNPNSVPRIVESTDLPEGRQQLREILTDKLGAFPDAGTMGQGTASAERLPLLEELETRSVRDISERIVRLLEEHQPESWGLAAPGEINRAIVETLPEKWRAILGKNLALDLTRVPAKQLAGHFGAQA